MPWEIPVDSYDPETLDKGFRNAEPGRYHVQVVAVDEEAISKGSGSGQMVVDYEVLGGTTPNQEGATHRDFFAQTKAAMKRVCLFALACKLVTKEELAAAQKAGKNPVIDFGRAVGRQLCIELEADEYEGKKRSKCGFAIYAVDDPRAKGIPINKGMLSKAGDAGDAPFSPPAEAATDAGDDTPF